MPRGATAAPGLVAFIHPEGVADLRFRRFRMWDSIGEAQRVASVIYEGFPEGLPDLRSVTSHGGGMLPHTTGRLDRDVTRMPETMKNVTRKPSDCSRTMRFDACLHDPPVAEKPIRCVGEGRLLLGSDDPVGGRDPIGFVDAVGGLTPGDLARIRGGLAPELLGEAAP